MKEKKYNHKKIEAKWREIWEKENIYEPDLKKAKNPFYNLMMFPYPSAEGLHIGNMYAFVGTDIYGRFTRMRGKEVFEPIGLDGFGIHSENYALKIGRHPMKQAKISEKRFYKQLESVGNGFSWNERLETYDPEYYKWTQWIFVQMFKHGLAYREKAEVNWCPSCKTVLADEQVVNGLCERCDSEIIKKELEQWFFKTTKYAGRLLKDLEKIDWSEKVKIAQKNWIGKSEGALIKFLISNFQFLNKSQIPNPKSKTNSILSGGQNSKFIEVFTTRPDTIFGATYLALNPQHPIIKNYESRIMNYEEVENYIKKTTDYKLQTANSKTGVELKGVKAINPANGEEIPILVSDYVLAGYGTGAIMAVPAHDQRDFEFAKKFNLPIKMVVCPHYPAPTCPVLDEAYEDYGHLVASGKFTGLPSEKAKTEITNWLSENKLAEKKTIYRLRDWLISRQRYWGPPIPMIHCEKCGWQPVAEKDLPVKLPFIKNFKPLGKGVSPLASIEKFYKTNCPKCGGPARRETDVSDTFLDSAWYFFRYIDARNKKRLFNKLRAKKWLPVDMYIGGAEHSVLHLLYARFITKVFYDWKLINFQEPFKKFRAHGLIIKDGAKMSKSKGNIINPDKYIKKFGADALRLYLMFLGPFEQGGDFRDEGMRGVTRFLERVWRFGNLVSENTKHKTQNTNLEKVLHQSIKKITEDIENLRYNTAVSQMMVLLNEMEKNQIYDLRFKIYETFLKLLAPFAPYATEELWYKLPGHAMSGKSIHKEKWPKYDVKKIKEKYFKLVVQINGKVRDSFEAPLGIKEKKAKNMALEREKIINHLAGGTPRKIIFVPDKLINIVI